jgi:hypothetical protein
VLFCGVRPAKSAAQKIIIKKIVKVPAFPKIICGLAERQSSLERGAMIAAFSCGFDPWVQEASGQPCKLV